MLIMLEFVWELLPSLRSREGQGVSTLSGMGSAPWRGAGDEYLNDYLYCQEL